MILRAGDYYDRSRYHRLHGYALALAGLAILCLLAAAVVPAMPFDGTISRTDAPQTALTEQPTGQVSPERVEAMTTSDDSALEKVTPQDAVAINAAAPVSTSPNPAARPLVIPIGDGVAFTRSLQCLTTAIYYEAATQSDDGERAVAQVVLNRVRDPAYPNSVCGVVYEGAQRFTGCQFTFACDGSLARKPSQSGWERASRIASAAMAGRVFAPVGWSTHYHANYVVPRWAPELVKTANIGDHIFYRWPGTRGGPGAFTQKYAGTETLPGELETLLAGDLAPVDDATNGDEPVYSAARPVLAVNAAPAADHARPVPVAAAQRWVLTGPVRESANDNASPRGRIGSQVLARTDPLPVADPAGGASTSDRSAKP